MKYRRFGRSNWKTSAIGYGMWGLAAWGGTDKKEVLKSLDRAIELGCNFFDTAWEYGDGKSEKILGKLIKKHSDKKIYAASKIPPKNNEWPPKRGTDISDVFPNKYIEEYVDKSLKNLGLEKIDLMQFHVWDDAWADKDEWKNTIENISKKGKVERWGISINRWEPENSLLTLETKKIDSVQVIYNIFDQSPEDKLFPLCNKLDIGVIARVPFDEGTLTGNITKETTFPEGDWRNIYFGEENLKPSVERANALRHYVPPKMDLPEMALRFILSNPDVHTAIPGMRQLKHVNANMETCDGFGLKYDTLLELKKHRWDRTPTK